MVRGNLWGLQQDDDPGEAMGQCPMLSSATSLCMAEISATISAQADELMVLLGRGRRRC